MEMRAHARPDLSTVAPTRREAWDRAQASISFPARDGNRWLVRGPVIPAIPVAGEELMNVRFDSFPQARSARKRWCCALALKLLGVPAVRAIEVASSPSLPRFDGLRMFRGACKVLDAMQDCENHMPNGDASAL